MENNNSFPPMNDFNFFFTKKEGVNMLEREIDIGINKTHRIAVANGLKALLADTYTLYLQTHYFHWNVTGPFFRDLHLLFEEQYTEMALAVDEIAERIRTLGVYAPGTYKAFTALSSIAEVEDVPKANDMVVVLIKNHEKMVKTCRKVFKIAEKAADESSITLISDRMRVHERVVWMLRSRQ
ncbi:MAG: starvation-inducible DNA-binding protein [Enterobacterales bacterium]|jgi:starvation-inducible DNA-binding protein